MKGCMSLIAAKNDGRRIRVSATPHRCLTRQRRRDGGDLEVVSFPTVRFQPRRVSLRRSKPHTAEFIFKGRYLKDMDRFAILALLEARPGKERQVEEFLKSALPLVQAELGTTSWYALKMGSSKFGIFDTFADQEGRDAHLSGEVAKALFAKAEELFATAPSIEQPEILAVKTPNV
jgi:quinol monooxygenase YgiN